MKNFIRVTLMSVALLFTGVSFAQPIAGPQQVNVQQLKKSCDQMAVMMFDQIKEFQDLVGRGYQTNIEQVQVNYTKDLFRRLERSNQGQDIRDAKDLVISMSRVLASYYKENPEILFRHPQESAEKFHVFCYSMANQRKM